MDASLKGEEQSKREADQDFKSYGQNSSATRTTTTTTTSSARLHQPLTSTTTKNEGPSSSFKESNSRSPSSGRTREDSMGSNDATPSSTNGNGNKILSVDDLKSLPREELIAHTKQLQNQVVDLQEEKIQAVIAKDKLKDQLLEATRRENLLILKMASKEKEVLDVSGQLKDLKKVCLPSSGAEAKLEKALIDPAINLVFERMKQEVADAKTRVEDMQNELSAWKFTPDSNMGKRLMAKCRQLYQENEELGKMISSGKIAKIEGELALQKNFAEEIKKSQSEIDDFLVELDEDFEGMQSTICSLQQQLKDAKDQLLSFQTNMFKPNGCASEGEESQRLQESVENASDIRSTVTEEPDDVLDTNTVSSVNESTAATIDEEESSSRKRFSVESFEEPEEKRERKSEEDEEDVPPVDSSME